MKFKPNLIDVLFDSLFWVAIIDFIGLLTLPKDTLSILSNFPTTILAINLTLSFCYAYGYEKNQAKPKIKPPINDGYGKLFDYAPNAI